MAGDSDARIEKLIACMTLEEKAGQLTILADAVRPCNPDVNPEANTRNAQEMMEQIRAGSVGALFNGVGAEEGLRAQRAAVEGTRLGIPLLFGSDVIHGMRTIFPIPLGEAASFEPDLAQRTARATALEATAAGIHWTFAPMVDVARDQRWGRVAESSGEDVFLGARFAVARVRGFQGEDLKAADSLLATPKHFAAYGAVAAGMEYAGADISEATLRDVHLPAFKAAFDAGALTAMSAFNDVAGVPASANRWLLTDILRSEWGFKGFVVSDYTADMELIAHGYAADGRDAARLAFTAGVDMSMQSGLYAAHLPELVAKGEVPMAVLDEGVRRVLSVKAAIGLLDNPYRSLDPAREADDSRRRAHEALAREAARRSVVLLRNEGEVLPLKKAGQRIALIGPFSDDRENLEGCWTLYGDSSRAVSIEDGIRDGLAEPGSLQVVRGCDPEGPIGGGVEAAVAAARRADVVLLAVGEPQDFTGESQSRTQIVLPSAQQLLVEAVAGVGTPVVVLLKTGRALALTGAVRNAEAILVTWFLGTQTGTAIADVVFGDYNPSGHLPVSFPEACGQQPYFYNHPRTGRPAAAGEPRFFKARWREVANAALYPFGHGLSYTRFAYGRPELSAQRLDWEATLEVACSVTNVGSRAGEAVPQLYVHDRVASRVRPVRELKGFCKISLQPGESKRVAFTLSPEDLAFYGGDGLQAEPGAFDVWVAASSTDGGEPVSFELLPPKPERDGLAPRGVKRLRTGTTGIRSWGAVGAEAACGA